MREIVSVKYESEDGTLWRRKSEAAARDAEFHAAQEIAALLPPTVEGLSGWVQLDIRQVAAFRDAVVTACKRMAPGDHYGTLSNEDLTHPGSYASRIMSERVLSPLNELWLRANRIDQSGREWEQMFFVTNQGKGLEEFPRPFRP